MNTLFRWASWAGIVLLAVMMLMSIAFYLNSSMSLVYAIMMMICSFMIFESLDQVGAFNGLTRTIENCVVAPPCMKSTA